MPVSERPLRRDAERNRQRILEAARELFAERGLGVTLNDIAHHASSTIPTRGRRSWTSSSGRSSYKPKTED